MAEPDVPALQNGSVELVRSSQGAPNVNDALIALPCHHCGIPFIANSDRDSDELPWLRKRATPHDLYP